MNQRLCSLLSKSFLNFNNQNRSIHATLPQAIKLTNVLNAEPPKAKKRIDPALLKAKEERRKRKIEKEIKKLEKFGRKLKPIEELRADQQVLKELNQRKRVVKALSEEESYNNQNIKNEWSKYKQQQFLNETNQIKLMCDSQKRALNELKLDNLKLYEMAIQIDEKLIDLSFEGPSYTPPIKGYEPPEGDYIDSTYLFDRK